MSDFPWQKLCSQLNDMNIIWSSLDGRIKFASNNFLGYLKSELGKLSLFELLDDKKLPALEIKDKNIVINYRHRDGRIISYQTQIIHLDSMDQTTTTLEPPKLENKRSKSEGGKSQKLILFNLGKAISGAPNINGTNQLPKPPIIAGITKKKIIINACAVTITLYN